MNKIYEQAKDLHVVGVYVYPNSTKTDVYADVECTEYFKKGELKEAFIKGSVILVLEDKTFKAVGYTSATSDEEYDALTFVNSDETITLNVAEPFNGASGGVWN